MRSIPTLNDVYSETPSFSDFLYLEAQKGGLYLGQIPNPMTGEKEVNFAAAGHLIGTLKMLEDKTQGNLNQEEERLLASALQNLADLYEKTSQEED